MYRNYVQYKSFFNYHYSLTNLNQGRGGVTFFIAFFLLEITVHTKGVSIVVLHFC